METFFAPPGRTGEKELARQLDLVASSGLVSALLHSVGMVLAVVNRQRQVVALNDAFLKMLGLDDPQRLLGMRPGEALKCVHAGEGPAGCGTTKYCPSCGAAAALVACLEEGVPAEKICALRARRNGGHVDLAFSVRSCPLTLEGGRYGLLFLEDITRRERWAALERSFFHDVNNLLNVLKGASEMLAEEDPSELAGMVRQAVTRLTGEVAIQRQLVGSGDFSYRPDWRRIPAGSVLKELAALFANHAAARDREIVTGALGREAWIETDPALLLRVLGNMVINALEATGPGGKIRIWTEIRDRRLSFLVWNAGEIPPDAVLRMFQRSFSTKDGPGRGFGTYSMKLFGEEILKGKVDFTTSAEAGTVFRFTCPLAGQPSV